MIGYWLVQALQNALPGRQVACLVSRTLVRRGRPGVRRSRQVRRPGVRRASRPGRWPQAMHWEVRQDGARWRRVVPSPEPAELLDLPAIRILLGGGAIVVCSGGGGVPVVAERRVYPRGGSGRGQGPDRRAAGLPAAGGRAAAAHRRGGGPGRYGTAQARPIRRATPAELRGPRPSRPGRWGPRSTPCAASSRRPGSRPPSDGSPTPRPCSPARPGRASRHEDPGQHLPRAS